MAGENETGNSQRTLLIIAWSAGYVAAVNEDPSRTIDGQIDLTRAITTHSLASWIDRDCRANPKYTLLQAVRRLILSVSLEQQRGLNEVR